MVHIVDSVTSFPRGPGCPTLPPTCHPRSGGAPSCGLALQLQLKYFLRLGVPATKLPYRFVILHV